MRLYLIVNSEAQTAIFLPADATGLDLCTSRSSCSEPPGVVERIFYLPIVYEVMEKLKKSLGFCGR
jgi:hypothetical protein